MKKIFVCALLGLLLPNFANAESTEHSELFETLKSYITDKSTFDAEPEYKKVGICVGVLIKAMVCKHGDASPAVKGLGSVLMHCHSKLYPQVSEDDMVEYGSLGMHLTTVVTNNCQDQQYLDGFIGTYCGQSIEKLDPCIEQFRDSDE